jgi:hypothetical protein
MARNTTEADFCLIPQKMLFPFFEVPKSGFFVKQLPKSEIES